MQMSSEKQIAANRLNAQKSTGPSTPEGRAAVRLNGVKHGLTARTLVLKGESESDFTALLESYEAEHQPTTPTEEALVLQLTMAAWRLRRLYHAEAGYYAYKLKDTADLGVVMSWNPSTMATFHRQETRLERTFYRALHELALLRRNPVGRVPDLPSKKINNIHPAATAAPAPALHPAPETAIHVVPPPEDMQ